ncbi:unnamed protein product, partial [marine sediment metagenome]
PAAHSLAVPQKTLSNWLIVANSEANDTQPLSILAKNSSIIISHNNHHSITLFPCKYEEVGIKGVALQTIDLWEGISIAISGNAYKKFCRSRPLTATRGR